MNSVATIWGVLFNGMNSVATIWAFLAELFVGLIHATEQRIYSFNGFIPSTDLFLQRNEFRCYNLGVPSGTLGWIISNLQKYSVHRMVSDIYLKAPHILL